MTHPGFNHHPSRKSCGRSRHVLPGTLAGSQEGHCHRQSRRSAGNLVRRCQYQERYAALVRESRARIPGRPARRRLRASVHPAHEIGLPGHDERADPTAEDPDPWHPLRRLCRGELDRAEPPRVSGQYLHPAGDVAGHVPAGVLSAAFEHGIDGIIVMYSGTDSPYKVEADGTAKLINRAYA